MTIMKQGKMIFLTGGGEVMKVCLLKRFGILNINEYVECREHPNPKFIYIKLPKNNIDNDWHTVPKEDVEIIK